MVDTSHFGMRLLYFSFHFPKCLLSIVSIPNQNKLAHLASSCCELRLSARTALHAKKQMWNRFAHLYVTSNQLKVTLKGSVRDGEHEIQCPLPVWFSYSHEHA